MGIIIRPLLFFCGIIFLTHTPLWSKREPFMFDGRSFGCDQTMVREIDYFKTEHHTCISVLLDKNGKKFIVKQDTRDRLFWHLGAARDRLGAFIAESIGVPVNRVTIIPAYADFPGKRLVRLPATLHSFVPGVMVKELPKESRVRIQQDEGLTKAVLKTMSEHPDLLALVALDTFIANADRHKGNFFYDEKSNRFFAIDLESSFNKNLAVDACDFVQSLIDNPEEKISPKRLLVLKKYRTILKKLIKRHTPESMYNKLVDFAFEGGILTRSLRAATAGRLMVHKKAIEKNYASCKKLVSLIDKLVADRREKSIR